MAPAVPDPAKLAGLVKRAAAIRSRFDAYEVIRELGEDCGYASVAVIAIPPQRESQIARNVVVANWPESFVREYDSLGLFANSAAFIDARGSCTPIMWESEAASVRRPADERESALALFRRYGLQNCLLLPVRNPAGSLFTVALCGGRPDPEPETIARALLVATYLVDRLSGLAEDASTAVRLSDRERQCLEWTAAGKTSGEIGAILALSEHTVNQYVTSACQKLGTVNRVQAVAKAIRLAIIS